MGGRASASASRGAVEAAGVIVGHIGNGGAQLTVRQREGEAAALAGAGFGQQHTALALRNALAQGQTQAQALRGQRGGLTVQVTLKQGGELLLGDAAACIGDGEEESCPGTPQLHGNGAAGGGEFEGIGQQVEQQLLHGVRGHGADMPVHGADEPQLQPQQGSQAAGFFAGFADHTHDIPVLKRQRLLAGQIGGGGQTAYQTEHLIVALVQQCGPGIQSRVLLPGTGGSQLGGGQMKIAEGSPQLRRDIGKQRRQVVLIRLHGMLLSEKAGDRYSICGRGRTNRGKPWLQHH